MVRVLLTCGRTIEFADADGWAWEQSQLTLRDSSQLPHVIAPVAVVRLEHVVAVSNQKFKSTGGTHANRTRANR